MSGAAAPPGWAIVRLVVMSWCWALLADFLWIPLAALGRDLGLSTSVLGLVFGLNLGARFIPNTLVTIVGIRSELPMMLCVLLAYAISMIWEGHVWSLYIMGVGAGCGFVRGTLTMHQQISMSRFDEEINAQAAKYCGSARNCGTIVALTVPVLVYSQVGWSGLCVMAMAIVLLYIGLAALGPLTEEVAQVKAERSEAGGRQHIPWIDWVLAAAFVVMELQFNLSNTAVPITLTRTFGMDLHRAGAMLAVFNAISMCFLALLPSLPFKVFHQGPLNILFALAGVMAAWMLAVLATGYLDSGFQVFAPSILVFMLAAYLVQVYLNEVFTSVLDTEQSKLLVGISETIGCVFSMVGGILGDELVVYGAAAPFIMQASIAAATFLFVGMALGHRRTTLLRAAGEESTCFSCISGNQGCVRQTVVGIVAIAGLPGSFVGAERSYRRSLRTSEASATGGAASATAVAGVPKALVEPFLRCEEPAASNDVEHGRPSVALGGSLASA